MTVPGAVVQALAAAAMIGAFVAVDLAQPQQAVRLTVEIPRTVSLHLPVVLSIGFENQSRMPVFVDMAQPAFRLSVQVRMPDGTEQRVALEDPGGPFSSAKDLPPGYRWLQEVVLDEHIRFSQTGEYELTLAVNALVVPKAAGVAVSAPRVIEQRLEVGERNEDALRAFCAAALAAIQGPISPDRGFAAIRLAFVIDPIALPYLRAGLETDWGHRLWDGFLRIGGPEAREMLEELSRSPNPALSTGAHVTLARLNARR